MSIELHSIAVENTPGYIPWWRFVPVHNLITMQEGKSIRFRQGSVGDIELMCDENWNNRVNLIEQMQLAILYFRHLNIGGWGYIVRLLFVIIPSFHPQDQNEIIRIRSSLFTCTSIFLLQKVSNKKYLAYFVSDILPREKQITEIFDLWNIFSSYCAWTLFFSNWGLNNLNLAR